MRISPPPPSSPLCMIAPLTLDLHGPESHKFPIITACKRLQRLCFYTCLSFCPLGTGTPQTRDTPQDQVHPPDQVPSNQVHPRDQEPLRTRYIPQDQVHPGTRYTPQIRYTPLDQVHPPGPGTPPGTRYNTPRSSVCWEIRATSSRYASYWNAFLFTGCLLKSNKVWEIYRKCMPAHMRGGG